MDFCKVFNKTMDVSENAQEEKTCLIICEYG